MPGSNMYTMLFHTYPIKPTTTPTHMSHLINTRAKAKTSIESIATKIKNKVYFGIFLWNVQWTFDNNGSFNVENKTYFLFHVFVIFSNYYGYLFIITIITYNIDTTTAREGKCATLIGLFFNHITNRNYLIVISMLYSAYMVRIIFHLYLNCYV